MKIFGSLRSLERVLSYHLARHNVLASNLANAETPGYQPRELAFSESLAAANQVATTDPKHMAPPEGSLGAEVQELEAATGADQNGVQIEKEMAKLSANRLRYEAGIEITRRRIGLLRYAANDGQG